MHSLDGDLMSEPHFSKPDRYKLDSYRTYNFKWPETYDSCFALRFFRVTRWDGCVIAQLLPALTTLDILDVGCATGRLLAALADAGAKNLSGTDLAPRILQVAQRKLDARGASANLRPADAEDRIPWSDASFDVVTLTGVFHHLMRPRDALVEIARVLRPTGRLLLVDVWFPPPLRALMNLCLRLRPAAGDYRYYSPSAVVGILGDLGWRRIQASRAGWSGFIISAECPVQLMPTLGS